MISKRLIIIPVLIIVLLLGLYAIAEFSGFGIRTILFGTNRLPKPQLTCSMAFSDKDENRETLSAKHNPAIVIRNQGPVKIESVAWTARVYRYDTEKKAVTAFATQDPRKRSPADLQKELLPSHELRQTVIGLPGKHIVAVYFVSIDYRIAAAQEPSQLKVVFFAVNQNVYDANQFQSDERHGSIMQAIRSFDRSLAPQPPKANEKGERTSAVKQPPLSIQVYGVYRSGGTGPLLAITDGVEMSSGDHYKIYFRANRDCYAYIYQMDAKGEIFQLFPLHQFDGLVLNQKNPVKGGVNYMLPSRNRYFYLDDTTGEETLYFATYLHRNTKLEESTEALQEALGSDDSDWISGAKKSLATYLNTGRIDKNTHLIFSPVSWKSSQPTAPVLGYHFKTVGGAGIHAVQFIHR